MTTKGPMFTLDQIREVNIRMAKFHNFEDLNEYEIEDDSETEGTPMYHKTKKHHGDYVSDDDIPIQLKPKAKKGKSGDHDPSWSVLTWNWDVKTSAKKKYPGVFTSDPSNQKKKNQLALAVVDSFNPDVICFQEVKKKASSSLQFVGEEGNPFTFLKGHGTQKDAVIIVNEKTIDLNQSTALTLFKEINDEDLVWYIFPMSCWTRSLSKLHSIVTNMKSPKKVYHEHIKIDVYDKFKQKMKTTLYNHQEYTEKDIIPWLRDLLKDLLQCLELFHDKLEDDLSAFMDDAATMIDRNLMAATSLVVKFRVWVQDLEGVNNFHAAKKCHGFQEILQDMKAALCRHVCGAHVVNTKGEKAYVFSIHGPNHTWWFGSMRPRNDAGYHNRYNYLRAMVKFGIMPHIQDDDPVIICGDFNLQLGHQDLHRFQGSRSITLQSMNVASVEHERANSIDHCLHKGIAMHGVAHPWITEYWPFDHYPVLFSTKTKQPKIESVQGVIKKHWWKGTGHRRSVFLILFVVLFVVFVNLLGE